MPRFTKYNLPSQRKTPKKKGARVDWQPASDVEKRIKHLSKNLELDWLKTKNIYGFRSSNSKTRAYARIWGLPRIWQKALKNDAAYVIEVISEKFDMLSEKEQDKVLIHELVHIPKNFSGSLIPHYRKGSRNFHKQVGALLAKYNMHKRQNK